MKKIFLIVAVICSLTSCLTYTMTHYKICYRKEYRRCYSCVERLNFLDTLKYSEENDTIFILKCSPDFIIDGGYYGTIWNKNDTLEFDDGKLTQKIIEPPPLFPRYMMKLISEWDIEEIKKEEIRSPKHSGLSSVIATRIIVKNKRYKIECVEFEYFYDSKRDPIYDICPDCWENGRY